MGRTTSTVEQVVVVGVIIIAIYMSVRALSFPERIGLLPKISGIVTIVFGISILLKEKILSSLNNTDSGSLISIGEGSIENSNVSEERINTVEGTDRKWTNEEVTLIALIAAYALTGFLIGILWVTPVFVVIFLLWRGHTLTKSGIIGLASVSIPYAMMYYLNIDYMSGILFGGI